MSKIEQLLSFVEDLNSRSNDLVESMQESNMIIDNIASLNDDIHTADSAIDSISNLIFENHHYIREFDNLYEKCFYLEGSLHMNDDFTNKTSFENLSKEYKYLLEKYTNKNRNYVYHEDQPEEKKQIDQQTVSTPGLKSAISISDLKLKPIRCLSSKISKKKSRYRLSHAYTLNPLLEDGASFLPITEKEDDEVIGLAIPQPPNYHQDSLQTGSPGIMESPNIMDSTVIYQPRSFTNASLHPVNDVDTVSTSPPSQSQVRVKSNSLPATPITAQIDTLFRFTDFDEGCESRESELEKLRTNRLRHFISYDHGFTNNDMLKSSPKFYPVPDINHLDIDSISAYSDFSYHSPDSDKKPSEESEQKKLGSDDDFDDFKRYLRRSRVDLNRVLPLTPIKKSNSHDSMFSSRRNTFQFHNPITSVLVAPKQHFIQPTIEAIYSNKDSGSHSLKAESSSKLLSQVISQNDPPSISSTPTKKSTTSFKIFNILHSPSKSLSTSCALTEEFDDSASRRRNSLGKSLTENFRMLVNNNHQLTPVGSLPSSMLYKPKPSPPPKIKRLKNRNKLEPITMKNTMQNQRLPPPIDYRGPRKDGYHSKLTIGPHKTKIIDHGDSSVFKKPLVSKVSHNSLREALSESFL